MPAETIEIDLRETLLAHLGLPFPITVEPRTPLKEVLRIMRENSTGSVLVQNDQQLLGIFTERDFLRIVGHPELLNQPIENHMTKKPITISEKATLEEAVRLMTKKDIRHLPVMENDQKANRILSIRDVIDFLAEFFPQEILNLPLDSRQMFHKKEGG